MEFPEPDVDKMTVSSDNSVMRENTFFLALQSTLHQLQIHRLSQILHHTHTPPQIYFILVLNDFGLFSVWALSGKRKW